MRILSIKIRNLASLRGEQPAIALRGPQLGDAGLIAVTGPTGAGKTTLFDAVCLALYDETPRTRGRGRDPRDLLARGAAEAEVELELELDGGAHWRAEWSVHRARGQADGPLQMSRQRIADGATGVVLAEGKKQVQALVEKSLGLSFDQFTSVVLIAQGQFAKFLEATDAERSALLERLTGTEIYSELSRAAYERARLAQEQVSELDKLAQHFAGLSPEDRDLLGQKLALEQQELAAQEELIEKAAAQVRHLGDLVELRGRRAAASRELAATTAAQAAAGPEEERCRAGERAALAGPALQQVDTLERRRAEARAAAAGLKAAAAEARDRLANAREQLTQSFGRLLASGEEAAAQADRRAAAALLAGETLETLRAGLKARELASEQAARRQQEAGQAQQELEQHEREVFAIAGQLREARERLAERRARATALHARLNEESAGQTREHWARRRLDLRQALDLASELGSLDLVALERAEKQLRQAAAKEAQAHAAAQEQLAAARSEREQHEALLRLAYGQAELSEHRPTLRPGEPCPLCGSTEHPWASRPAAEDRGILRRAEADKARREALEQEAAAAVSVAAASHQSALLAAERARTQLGSAEKQVSVARARWLELRLVLPELPEAPLGWSTPELAEIENRLEAIDRLWPEFDQARRALAQAEQAVLAGEKEEAIAGERLEAAERRRSEAAESLAEASLAEDDAALRFSQRASELAAAMGIAPPVPAAAAAFLARLDDELATWQRWRERQEGLAALAERTRRRRPELSATVAAPGPAAVAAAPAEPPPLGAFEKELERALEAEGASQEAGRLAEDRARRAAAELASLDQQLEAAAAELAEAARGQGFADVVALRQALLAPAELANLRRQLEELGRERERKAARLAALEQELLALADKTGLSPELPDPEGEKARRDAELAEARRRQAEILARCIDLEARLKAEGERQAEREKLEAELEAARRAHQLAARLSQLIGQKDGGKFRRFAQQLNLDLLLELANLRLDRLAPRYQLARLGESLDLEVIDREMAEERRPVNTLSGGESFLVSLALALALADLRRGSLRLGTLFLDEGFGSLDEDTLDTALSVLEQLQADQNTQILIISHVGALKERIDHRIDIQKLGGGRSRLSLLGGLPAPGS